MAYGVFQRIFDTSPMSIKALNDMLEWLFKKVQGGIGPKETNFIQTPTGGSTGGIDFSSDCSVQGKTMWNDGNCKIEGTDAERYIRFQNGVMICTKTLIVSAPAITTVWGALYKLAVDIALGAYPGGAQFMAIPAISINYDGEDAGLPAFVIRTAKPTTSMWGSVNLASAISGTLANARLICTAIGRWK